MFQKPFSFKGRIRRTEYCLSLIIIYPLLFIIMIFTISNNGEMYALDLAAIPLLWMFWAQGAKRCHDLGKNGWWQLMPIYNKNLLHKEGQRFPNKYGDDPKVGPRK